RAANRAQARISQNGMSCAQPYSAITASRFGAPGSVTNPRLPAALGQVLGGPDFLSELAGHLLHRSEVEPHRWQELVQGRVGSAYPTSVESEDGVRGQTKQRTRNDGEHAGAEPDDAHHRDHGRVELATLDLFVEARDRLGGGRARVERRF